MGLRFRKTISLLPGVKLNISKSGVGVSAGVPGLRGSINTSGRVTGTASIPGTGVSYVKTKKIFGNKKNDKKSKDKTEKTTAKKDTKAAKTSAKDAAIEEQTAPKRTTAAKKSLPQIDSSTLKAIHRTADETVDWKKIAASPVAPDESYDQRRWSYFYSLAPDVLKGDIDTYLKLIYEVNPLDDLLDYGDNFEFGTDDPSRMEVEFVINDALLTEAKQTMSARDYNLLLQDFVCSMALRIARDVFALLPVKNTVVHVVMEDKNIFSADFDSASMSKINFDYIDPSNTATQFRHIMKFDEKNGFAEVGRL